MGNIKAVVSNPKKIKRKKRRYFGKSKIVQSVQAQIPREIKIVEVKNPKKKKRRRKMSPLQLQYFGKRKVTNMAKKRRKRAVSKTYKKRRRISNPVTHYKKRSRRHVYKNPSSFSGISDILIRGAVAGAGAFGLLFISDIVADKFLQAPATVTDASGKAKRNLTTLIMSMIGGWAAMKFVKGKHGEALAQGMVAGAILRIAVNVFNLPVGLGESSSIDNVLDNLLKGETLLGQDDTTLLGMDDTLFGEDLDVLDGEDNDDLDGMY